MGAQNKENHIKPVVFSIFCFSKGLRRRAAGRPPDGRRTPPGPPKNVINLYYLVFSVKEKVREKHANDEIRYVYCTKSKRNQMRPGSFPMPQRQKRFKTGGF
jgi:hypothetical protein